MEITRYCQSCGMPLVQEADYGTEAGGAKSADYCTYCRRDGAFAQECTMEEMIEFCLRFELQRDPSLSADEARRAMRAWYPTLKRWKAGR